MSRQILVIAVALLCGCSGGNPVDLVTRTRWTNAESSCSKDYWTFNNSMIVYHQGSRRIPAYDIKHFDVSARDSTIVLLAVEPVGYFLNVIKRGGYYKPGLVMHYKVDGDRMTLVATNLGAQTETYTPKDDMYRQYNFVACPRHA